MAGQSRTWVVDEVEEGVAAIEEDGARLLHVPAWLLPPGAREGDVVSVTQTDALDGSVTLHLSIDRAATDEALRRSREQIQRLAANDPGGDIVL